MLGGCKDDVVQLRTDSLQRIGGGVCRVDRITDDAIHFLNRMSEFIISVLGRKLQLQNQTINFIDDLTTNSKEEGGGRNSPM